MINNTKNIKQKLEGLNFTKIDVKKIDAPCYIKFKRIAWKIMIKIYSMNCIPPCSVIMGENNNNCETLQYISCIYYCMPC